ncbi:MAG: TIGR03915 family putative DNA repair protein [Pseudomonadota bacterium]
MTGLAQKQQHYRAYLASETDLNGWRDQARHALAANILPEHIDWYVEQRSATLDLASHLPLPQNDTASALRLNRQHLTVLMTTLLHSDADRFALAYRLLWRMREQPRLMGNPADKDVKRIWSMAKNVRRDIHKMHAFVRFRKIGERADDKDQIREQFAAWFEPEHHITKHVAPFFRNRFTGMDWLIITPRASIAWDGQNLRAGPGGKKTDVPDSDAIEDEWRSYYRSIFNPARLKMQAMKSEMPMKYWKNLPEALLISRMVEGGIRQAEKCMEPL